MKNTQLLLIFTVTIMVLTFLTVTGCDEGMNMVGPVITEPGEEPMDTPEGPITTNGEMKQPPDESPEKQPEPTPQSEPEKPKTPVPEEPKPTVTIDTVVQADDKSVTISGTSTDVPEGAKVTIVLGDGAITLKSTVDKDGAWSVTVPAKKTAQLAPGTIAVTATAKKVEAESSFEIAPPTLTIDTVVQADDGSVTVSGTSTDVSAGETVTITFGGALKVTATTDEAGTWTATLSGTKAANLVVGTVGVKAAADTAEDTSSFENDPPEMVHGIVVSTDVERIMVNIVADVYGEDDPYLERKYEARKAQYGSLFDLETEEGQAYFRRFVVYKYEQDNLFDVVDDEERWALRDESFERAYGFSASFGEWLVLEVYLKETGEKITGIWQKNDISMEYFLIQIANPDATEEELLELLRESIRAGNINIYL